MAMTTFMSFNPAWARPCGLAGSGDRDWTLRRAGLVCAPQRWALESSRVPILQALAKVLKEKS